MRWQPASRGLCALCFCFPDDSHLRRNSLSLESVRSDFGPCWVWTRIWGKQSWNATEGVKHGVTHISALFWLAEVADRALRLFYFKSCRCNFLQILIRALFGPSNSPEKASAHFGQSCSVVLGTFIKKIAAQGGVGLGVLCSPSQDHFLIDERCCPSQHGTSNIGECVRCRDFSDVVPLKWLLLPAPPWWVLQAALRGEVEPVGLFSVS